MLFANDGLRKRSSRSDSLADFASRRADALLFLVLEVLRWSGTWILTRASTPPHAGIILPGPVDPAALAETLDAAPDTAIPIADFGGGCKGQAFETQQTEFTIDNITREPACAAPCYLVPSGEESAHALIDVLVNAAEC
jgi:hypothetical protein